jgi:hypothetical protein
VNPRFTGGNDTDGKLGDEGILVVLETKDDDGRLVEAPGDLSLTILDPAESGERALVAQWDFTSDEMAQHFRRMRFGQGYVFELPWSGEPPKHEELTLRVRLTSLDGRTMTTQRDFKVQILGHDEFVTRSVRAGRIRPWVPERAGETGTVPASQAKSQLVNEAPPLGDYLSPGQPTLRESRPLWRPDR